MRTRRDAIVAGLWFILLAIVVWAWCMMPVTGDATPDDPIAQINAMIVDWEAATGEEKASLRENILVRAGAIPRDDMPPELAAFIESLFRLSD